MEKEQENIVLPFEFKAVSDPDEKGYAEFEGYAAAFDNVDLGRDVIVGGAFADTIKEDPNVPILLDHMALLRETAGFNKAASEDNYGLKITGQLNTNLEAGTIAHELSKQALALGKQIGLSIGYGIKEKEIDPDTGIRTLKNLKLYEYSFTNFPMNPKASITAMKDRQLAAFRSVVEQVLEEKGIIEPPNNGGSQEEEFSEEEAKALLESITNLNKEVKDHV